jgi:hypothetical protein
MINTVPNAIFRKFNRGKSEMTAQDVIQLIERAFDGVARGDGITLHEAVVIDDHASDEERTRARSQDTESRWQDVPDNVIEREYTIFSFLDDAGFRYDLPAYMIWALRNVERTQSVSLDSTVYALEPSSYFPQRSGLFNHAQARAILHFLEWIVQTDAFRDDRAALEAWAHWTLVCEAFASTGAA